MMTKNLFPMSTIILYNQLNALYKRPRLTLNREYLSEYLKGQSVSKTDIAKIDVELHSLATCEYFSKFLFHIQSAMAASASFRMSSSLQESAVAVVKVMAFVCGQILFRQHHRQCKHRFPKKNRVCARRDFAFLRHRHLHWIKVITAPFFATNYPTIC